MSTLLLITKCEDSLMWYSHLVGQVVPLFRDLPAEKCWMSFEPAGYKNIIKHTDATPVPTGYTAARRGTVLQQHDLIFLNGQWHAPTLDQLGTPAAGHLVIRKDQS